jgi:predicted nucleic acid-binding protein
VQEFLNVALHKWEEPMGAEDANEYLNGTLEPLCAVFPSATLWRNALSIQVQSQYRFHDSLIVASAPQCGAEILYSEDLQAGRQFGNLEIRNPFN